MTRERDTPTPRDTDPRWLDANGDPIDEDHRGLVYDVQTLVNRRRALGIFGGVALTSLLAACGATAEAQTTPTATATATPTPTPTPSNTPSATAAASGPLTAVPDETGGPYPADGSNGVNVLDDSGIVRSDIRSSFGSSTTVAAGVPLTIALTVRDAATGTALAGKGVYLWHCDQSGNYSLYSKGLENENYLRGVQATDANGTVTFTSIYPACYSGRWPHIHFEVYDDVATAVASGPIVKTSQIALPAEVDDTVYATSGYEQSIRNLAQISLQTDNVFGDDGGIHQIATMSGSVASGYTAALTIGV
ncbi:intradiol ring-cleavage dioxygenase [Microbacterium rhizomatis]|uniref:Intradiol ring-cleavage dioxygenase n=1 Tax=Microbacterium rhizomatis TaxID=1631477 RepID=A0A5J5J0X3_9MICO|nr:intradiol ring-cleavage dioxygenase [Microbacterium rhizomatis]KAA9105589.1 intradiol ring-cleavage dioxygenase [Microbacterium rhizomatis]